MPAILRCGCANLRLVPIGQYMWCQYRLQSWRKEDLKMFPIASWRSTELSSKIHCTCRQFTVWWLIILWCKKIYDEPPLLPNIAYTCIFSMQSYTKVLTEIYSNKCSYRAILSLISSLLAGTLLWKPLWEIPLLH